MIKFQRYMEFLRMVTPVVFASFAHGELPPPNSLNDVYAPVDVAIAPENSYKGLVMLPDGEIRHYGFNKILPAEGSAESKHSYHKISKNAKKDFYYLSSRDNGLTWKRVDPPGGGIADGTLQPQEGVPNRRSGGTARHPKTGHFFQFTNGQKNGAYVYKADDLESSPVAHRVSDEKYIMMRAPYFVDEGRRILFAAHTRKKDRHARNELVVLRSDDDGTSWQRSVVPAGPEFRPVWPHKGFRWQNYLAEPTITELGGGRLWMLCRTSMDYHYESFSDDFGMTWTAPRPSRFYGTLTMPTFLRLNDGRLLLFWCNTTPLPEVDRSADPTIREHIKSGGGEDVFTNRDANHVAISEDDGKTWIGFREVRLNPIRNEADYAIRGGLAVSPDRSVHQFQALELPKNKILLSSGQHPLSRRITLFDIDWIYEPTRSNRFEDGKASWSTFKYRKGIEGHCAYNRDPGAPLNHPP